MNLYYSDFKTTLFLNILNLIILFPFINISIYHILLSNIIIGFLDYFIHRFILHNIRNLGHNLHHKYAYKKEIISYPLIIIFFIELFFYFISLELLFFLIIYYLFFEILHYIVHHVEIDNFLLNKIKYCHHMHHINSNINYGVFTPSIDVYFGTLHKKCKYNLLVYIPFPIISFLGIIPHLEKIKMKEIYNSKLQYN